MNFIETIQMHAIGLIDGTCYDKFNKMDDESARNTAIKVFACAILAGIITALICPVLSPIFAIVVGAGVFTYDTLSYEQGPLERARKNIRNSL